MQVSLAFKHTTFQGMRLTDHVTLNFNNNMSMAAVFLDIKKAFVSTSHYDQLYTVSGLEFSTCLVKLIASLLSKRKFEVFIESEFSTHREIEAGVSEGVYI
jgi:hypothetical protein